LYAKERGFRLFCRQDVGAHGESVAQDGKIHLGIAAEDLCLGTVVISERLELLADVDELARGLDALEDDLVAHADIVTL